jgi:hypothetical protein
MQDYVFDLFTNGNFCCKLIIPEELFGEPRGNNRQISGATKKEQ